MRYLHPGDAWTDVVSADERRIYCDACAQSVRVELRERCADSEDMRPMSSLGCLLVPMRVMAGYFCPEADAICDRCGVIAAHQHTEEA